mmetsp:Transcript_30572/g.39397  ORF Transcript_30572/g.39397 Transcript_30572/m.39397 type:complete len:641 (-) Transcript_30572:232-2154(-)
MSAVIHRSIKPPCCRDIEPVGEAHYNSVTALITGLYVRHGDQDASKNDENLSGGSTKEVLTAESIPGLNFYERLGLDPLGISVGPEQVKRAYHKALLTYHPDKTGRGDEDEVFLAIQEAHDTLSNDTKRKAYDSLNDFDETIPTSSDIVTKTDKKTGIKTSNFYELFGKTFHSNGRFAVKKPVPLFGDDNTPFSDVFKFYEYWEVFESWRDFSLSNQEHDPEQADSREEKRWMIKENMKGVKQLKKKDNQRIITLVERAKQYDPRLARAIQAEKDAKKALKEERRKEKENEELKLKEAENLKIKAKEEEEAKLKATAKEQKALRDKNKKAMRNIRAYLRRLCFISQEWHDANHKNKTEHMYESDLDEICEVFSSDLPKLQALLDNFGTLENTEDGPGNSTATPECLSVGLNGLREAWAEAKQFKIDEVNRLAEAKAERAAQAQAIIDEKNSKREIENRWNKEELSWLAKGARKFPAGSANRWETVANYINQQMRLANPKSKEGCLAKYTQIQQSNFKASQEEEGSSGGSGGGDKAATATSTNTTNTPTKNTGGAAAAETPSPTKNTTTTTTTAAAAAVVPTDKWEKSQQKQLEDALRKYPSTMDKADRWNAVTKEVEGKTKKQCIERFKFLRAKVAAAKK